MQQNFDGLQILFSKACDIEELKKLPARPVFDQAVCDFLNELAGAIRKDGEARKYPDIVTFGFFCRKANVERLKEEYYAEDRIGRGVSFHIAPSNVPINFAYSLVAGLLAGNACIVRVSSKDFEQTKILCRLMQQIPDDFGVGRYIAIVRYERDKKITDYFSSFSNLRVIWGGDHTVAEIRDSAIPPRCVEITFADRYSLCVLNAAKVLEVTQWEQVAQNFYNDTYLYDQNACSSPRLMYWIGSKDEAEKARQLFWGNIYEYIHQKYPVEPVIVVDKLTADYRMAIDFDDVKIEIGKDNLFHLINVESLSDQIVDYTCPGGSFIEYTSETIDDLKKVITPKYQTLSYLGEEPEKLKDWVIKNGLLGIDRIVPIGNTADFTLTWDGYNLIDMMSRKVYSI